MELPVYLFTGFLEAGKTRFIQESLAGESFNAPGNTVIIVCEEGVEELDPSEFNTPNVYIEYIEEESELSPALLSSIAKKHDAVFVMIEYNGMWQLSSLYDSLPEGWLVYQELFICDSTTAENYNKNMRSLMVDKLSSCDMAAFNRVDGSTDRMALHKLVRGVSRGAKIVYDKTDGTIEYDTIEDPLPFDINADVIKINDEDYGIWYRDLVEEMEKYDGKKVRFKGMVAKDPSIPKGSFACGRHVMTCCADDIKYSALACKWKDSDRFKTYDWVEVTGRISIEPHKMYVEAGPVIKVTSVVPAAPPKEQVVTFN